MRDEATFLEIIKSKDPRECKRLGRRVSLFDERVWKTHLRTTAYTVILQKFEADQDLVRLLLSTGDLILAEASQKDAIWGILARTTAAIYYNNKLKT